MIPKPNVNDDTDEAATPPEETESEMMPRNMIYLPADTLDDVKAGDPVEASVVGEVVEHGGKLCVKVTEFNGVPLDDEEEAEEGRTVEDVEKDMTAALKANNSPMMFDRTRA